MLNILPICHFFGVDPNIPRSTFFCFSPFSKDQNQRSVYGSMVITWSDEHDENQSSNHKDWDFDHLSRKGDTGDTHSQQKKNEWPMALFGA